MRAKNLNPLVGGIAGSWVATGMLAWLTHSLLVRHRGLVARLDELEGGHASGLSQLEPRVHMAQQVPARHAAGTPLQGLKVRGPFRGPTGYDHHVREFVRELVNQGVTVELVDVPGWGPARLPAYSQDAWFDRLNTPVNAATALHFCMPHQVVPDSRRINVNFTMFEASRIPPRWVGHHRRHDLIILPTQSSRDAWLRSGVPEDKIRLCPLGINTDLFAQPASPLPLYSDSGVSLARYAARFLNVAELSPRKNQVGLLRAWLRATASDDNAVLIMKLGCYAPGWWEEFQSQVDLVQQQTGKHFGDAAPVHIIRDIFSDSEMPRLYAAATHYISMSFGEGWDQAMVEAGASGLKLIAPHHSAYTAYLDHSTARLLASREVPAVFSGGGQIGDLFAGATWWQVEEEDAIEAIRAAIDGRDRDQGLARERILTEFTWERATRRLVDILSEFELTRGKGRRPALQGYTLD